ncbi:hypothetical protein HDV04_000756 [Boothiomyces sp. JEL0838]|nr:hypothetical protein HDV04_000756 [Boothiomyces sp. JEL0838]
MKLPLKMVSLNKKLFPLMQKTKLSKILEKHLNTSRLDLTNLDNFDCQTLQHCSNELKQLVKQEFTTSLGDTLYSLELHIISRPWQEQYPDLYNAIVNLGQIIEQTNKDLQCRIVKLHDRINKQKKKNSQCLLGQLYPDNSFIDLLSQFSPKSFNIQVDGLFYDETPNIIYLLIIEPYLKAGIQLAETSLKQVEHFFASSTIPNPSTKAEYQFNRIHKHIFGKNGIIKDRNVGFKIVVSFHKSERRDERIAQKRGYILISN